MDVIFEAWVKLQTTNFLGVLPILSLIHVNEPVSLSDMFFVCEIIEYPQFFTPDLICPRTLFVGPPEKPWVEQHSNY